MNALTRSRIEIGARALEFSRAHPDESDGYTTAVKELAELLERSERLAIQQRQGIAEVRAATARKRELRRSIRQRELVHIARAAHRYIDGLNRFRFAGDPDLFAAWRSASNVIGPASRPAKVSPPGDTPTTGDIKPAA
jgi:hypothetical protein